MGRIKLKNQEERVILEKNNMVIDKKRQEVKEESSLLFEDKGKRERNVKHYKMKDGSYQAHIFNDDVHYFDEEQGKYLSIDNSLKYSADSLDGKDFEGYENKQGKFKVKFAKETNDKDILVLKKDQYEVRWKLLEDDVFGSKRNKVEAELKEQNREQNNTVDEIIYRNIYEDVDLQYVVTPNKIKENIIVKSKKDKYVYKFEIETKNLDLELCENRQKIDLYVTRIDECSGDESKEIVFCIPMPYMIDNNGEKSENVEYVIEQKANGKYILFVEADSRWINHENRAFPVRIDPVILVNEENSGLIHTTLDSQNDDEAVTLNCLFVGNTPFSFHRSLLKFNLPQLSGKKVLSATLTLVVKTTYQYAAPINFSIHRILEPWIITNELRWSTQPSISDEAYCCEKMMFTIGKEYNLEVTKLVQDWSKYGNNGLVIKAEKEEFTKDDISSLLVFFAQEPDGEEEVNSPKLVINYINEKSQHSDEKQVNTVKRAGTHSVDLFTGKNRFVHEDGGFNDDRRLSLSISHVYNYNDKNYDFIVSSEYNYTPRLQVGRGWKLNVHQFLYEIYESSDNYTDSKKYLYIDQNGDEVIFAEQHENIVTYDAEGNVTDVNFNGKIYVDEQGRKLRCEVNGTDGYIYDSNGTTLYFRSNALERITDRNGDSIYIERCACSGAISRVVDSLGNSAYFYYNATLCNLNKIVFSDGRIINYEYDNGCGAMLTKIEYAGVESNPACTQFYYDEYCGDSRLTSIIDQSGYRLSVQYANDKVVEICDYSTYKEISKEGVIAYTESDGASLFSGNNTYQKKGKSIKIKYDNNTTAVITENGHAENYQFDSTGFCRCIYESKNALTQTSSKKEVIRTVSYKTFNGFDVSEIRPWIKSVNYIANSGFEANSNWDSIGIAVGNNNGDYAVEGGKSVRLTGCLTEMCALKQTVENISVRNGQGLILSGFAKAGSALPSISELKDPEIADDCKSKFRLCAKSTYTDGTTEIFEAPFDHLQSNWQFTAVGIQLNKDKNLKKIDVYVDYSYNNGVVYFDDINLSCGDIIYTKGKPRFYTKKDNETYEIDDLVEIKYKDTNHIFNWGANETEKLDKQKATYLDILSMQQNPTLIIINGEVEDSKVDPVKTKLVFNKNGVRKTYNLFDMEYTAAGITEIINNSGTVRLYKNKYEDIEKIVAIDNNGNKYESITEYDDKRRVIKETDFRGVTKEYTYTSNSYNNISRVKTTKNNTLQDRIYQNFDYINNRHLKTVYDERMYEGDTYLRTLHTYDESTGNLSTVKLPNGQTISYEYSQNNENLLGISTSLNISCSVPTCANETQAIGINYSYNKGFLTEITSSGNKNRYSYKYDGFGNLIETYWNGVLVVSSNKYEDCDYSISNITENDYNYDEIVLANGVKIKEVYDKMNRLVCRKSCSQVSVENGLAQYGSWQELFRVEYATDSKGETIDRIEYTIDKALVDGDDNASSSGWIRTFYIYDERGELTSTREVGARNDEHSIVKDDGGRVSKEIHSFDYGTLMVENQYYYDEKDGKGIVPDNRLIKLGFNLGTCCCDAENEILFTYDNLGRIIKQETKNCSDSVRPVMSETYSYQPRYSKDSCNCSVQVGTTNYLSNIYYKYGSTGHTEFIAYDPNGNIQKITKGSKSVSYTYDGINRLVSEVNSLYGKDYHYVYNSSGDITFVYEKESGSTAWLFKYEYVYANTGLTNIRKHNLTNNTVEEVFTAGVYDALGNPCIYKGNALTWKRGRLLANYGNIATYSYDSDNIRSDKYVGSIHHKYHTYNGNVLSERIATETDYRDFRYLYEGNKVVGIVETVDDLSNIYYLQYDANGNVARICDSYGYVLASYSYDAWGNHKVFNNLGLDITNNASYNNTIAKLNPFRYKGYYYDEETGLYYLQSRYYDPSTRRFINADNVTVVATDYLTTLNGQNLYSYCLNDPVNSYDPTGHDAVSIIMLIVAIIGLIGALVGLAFAVSAFAKEPSWLNLLFVVIAVIEVVMSVMGVIAAVKNLIASIAKVGAKTFVSTADDTARAGKKICNGEQGYINSNCFKAGTKVLTKDGYKNIEDIQVGDEVLSYDEQTGQQDYKKVVHLFRGETTEWHHIFVGGEEIVCTGEHPFFVDGKGFVEAKYLTKEDSLVLSNGSIVKIDKIEREKLLKPQTKYNFEVEDFHTYYVTEKDVLVHNVCFDDWLNSGEKNYTVYKGRDIGYNEVYTGITKQNLDNRLYQHNYKGKNFRDLLGKYSELTKNQARAIETFLIQTDKKSKMNKILSISKNHRFYDQAMDWAANYRGVPNVLRRL